MWPIDTTVIGLLDGTRACLHDTIDNFSRRIFLSASPTTHSRRSRCDRAARRQSDVAPSDTTPSCWWVPAYDDRLKLYCACNRVQGATATLALTATPAM